MHRLFPNARFSLWVDGKLELVVDPYQVLERYVWFHAFISLQLTVSNTHTHTHTHLFTKALCKFNNLILIFKGSVSFEEILMFLNCLRRLTPCSSRIMDFVLR